MSISQNDTLHDAQAQMIEACSESVARNPTISEFLTHVHPDDRERTNKAIDQMVAKGLGADVKYRLVHPER